MRSIDHFINMGKNRSSVYYFCYRCGRCGSVSLCFIHRSAYIICSNRLNDSCRNTYMRRAKQTTGYTQSHKLLLAFGCRRKSAWRQHTGLVCFCGHLPPSVRQTADFSRLRSFEWMSVLSTHIWKRKRERINSFGLWFAFVVCIISLFIISWILRRFFAFYIRLMNS